MAEQHNSGTMTAVMVLGGAAVGIGAALWCGMEVVMTVFPVAHLTFKHYFETLIHWHSSVVWKTKQPLPHPLEWHIVAAGVSILAIVGVLILVEVSWHSGKASLEKFFSSSGWFGGGGKAVDRESDDPAKWLAYKPKAFKAYQPAHLVKRNELRPSLKHVPIKDRRLEDYGWVLGYARNNPDYPVAASAELSMLVLGQPRSGKTGRLVIPWVMAWQGPLVTTSTKTEVLTTTLLARKRVSEHVYVLGLPGISIPEGVEPISYDICWFYESEWDTLTHSADRRAAIFAEAAADRHAQVWENSTRQPFACLLLIGFAWRCAQIKYQGKEHMTGKPTLFGITSETDHIEVVKTLSTLDWARTDNDVELVCTFLKQNIPGGKGGHVAEFVRGAARSFRGETSKTEYAQTITAMMAVALGKLNDPQIAAVFSTPWNKPVFDPETFLAESGTLYLISRDENSKDLAKFFSLVVNEIYAAAKRRAETMKRCDPPLAFVLDEVANIAPLPNLKSYMSEGGGQGVATIAVLQNFSQLKTTYDAEKADEIFSSANVILAFGGEKDPDALRRLCSLAGNTKVTMGSYDSNSKLTGRSENIVPALDPDKLSNMPPGWMLLSVPNATAIIAKAPYWSDKPDSDRAAEDKRTGRRWKREWGASLDEEASGYPYHQTRRALSYHAAYELGMKSQEIPLRKLVIEVPKGGQKNSDTGEDSANAEHSEEEAISTDDNFEDVDVADYRNTSTDRRGDTSPNPPNAKTNGKSTYSLVEKRSKIIKGGDAIDRLFNSIQREEKAGDD